MNYFKLFFNFIYFSTNKINFKPQTSNLKLFNFIRHQTIPMSHIHDSLIYHWVRPMLRSSFRNGKPADDVEFFR